MMPAVSTIRITVFSGARGLCITPFGTTNACPRPQIDGAIFHLDEEAAADDVEELVLVVVLVPVILALHGAEAHHGLVHLAQGLVVPGVLVGARRLR